ncbi:hypothetical protein MPSI1_000273 [Malassezia psittaci]|uniref:BHLH domain-containing protein n=1 Tax=Malassezia psittaci TaxID=1821823 RepID=A0AAF0F6R0_9BASI|nr:hypothetical protein MPSI1_000273 [Malassezia psittaci]
MGAQGDRPNNRLTPKPEVSPDRDWDARNNDSQGRRDILPRMETPALEKLRMHWTSHMDQYDVLSHPQFESPLPYLITSQPRKDSLALLRSRPNGSYPLINAMNTSNLPPTQRRRTQLLSNNVKSAYGKDPNWRSQQISFLHSEQQRHHSVDQSMPGPSERTYISRHSSPHTARIPPLEMMLGQRSPSPIQLAIPLRRSLSTDETMEQRPSSAGYIPSYNANLTRYGEEQVNVMEKLSDRPDTKYQPHLDLLRERKRDLQRRIEEGDPEALTQLQDMRAAKRRSNANGLLSEKEKKANHIASEQRRRANIRKGYELLSECLPAHRRERHEEQDEGSTPNTLV